MNRWASTDMYVTWEAAYEALKRLASETPAEEVPPSLRAYRLVQLADELRRTLYRLQFVIEISAHKVEDSEHGQWWSGWLDAHKDNAQEIKNLLEKYDV